MGVIFFSPGTCAGPGKPERWLATLAGRASAAVSSLRTTWRDRPGPCYGEPSCRVEHFRRSTQSAEDLEERARIMAARGVRRIIAIPVRGDAAGSEIIAGPVAEWMPAEERWRTYRDDEVIADPCLFEPVPVRALLDAVEADTAVVRAFLHKGHPVLIDYGDERYRAGEVKAAREHICMFLEARGVALDSAARARIASCSDPAMLRRWVMRAPYATSASDLFDGD